MAQRYFSYIVHNSLLKLQNKATKVNSGPLKTLFQAESKLF